jgi:subtilisin family serine protease
LIIINNGYSDDYYYNRDTKIPLQRVQNKYYLQTYIDIDASKFESIKDIVKKPRPIANLNSTERFKLFNRKNTEFGYWSVIISDARISEFGKNRDVKYLAPVFITDNKQEAILSNFIEIRLKNGDDITTLEQFAEKYSFDIIGNLVSMPLWFLLSCNKNSSGNALQIANILHETGKFSAVVPDFMIRGSLNCVNDTLFVSGQQWNLNGTFGINYCAARSITTGNPNVIVAVFDQGIYRDIPDITNFHPNSFDTETLTSPRQIYYMPGWRNHGTPVASIIGATSNNGLEIAGVAPGCRLMDISNRFTKDSTSFPYSRLRIADGIDWAWRNGASVINNSWSLENVFTYTSIDDAIDSALQRGRGGKGTVLVFSTGNHGHHEVAYPASKPNVIAVGASSPNGRRWNDSNHGDALDIVAPGDNVPMIGLDGINSGTSFAAPHVAAVAALILSVNPDLTHQQVRYIIESTARKVGGYNYQTTVGRPHGTWHREMGYGLLDAGAAVNMARTLCASTLTVTGTINTDRAVYGGTINASNVTVPSGRKLTLNGCSNININGNFTLEPGASLDIRVGP